MDQQNDIPAIDVAPSATEQETVFRRLRAAIMTGSLPPGTTLTIRGLAETMACSSTPVREAVRRLSTEHAIEVLGNRRMQVPAMTPTRFEEIFSLRVATETHAALRALPYVSEILIDRLGRIDAELDLALEAGDRSRLTILNHDFHRALYTANPHQTVMWMIESIWLQLGPFQRQVIEGGLEFYLIDRHQEILGALRDRDPDALAAALDADIRDGIYRSGKRYLLDRAPA